MTQEAPALWRGNGEDIRTDPSVSQMAAEMAAMMARAEALVITPDNAETSIPEANALAVAIAQARKGYKALLERFVRPFKDTVKRIEGDLKLALGDPLDRADAVVRHKLTAYEQARREMERLAREHALAEARKREEDERLARAARLERLAAQTGDAAYARAAEAALNGPARPVVVGRIEVCAPKPTSVGFVETWDVEIIDLSALVRAVADGAIPIDAIEANMVWLRREARQRRDSFAVPGVRAVKAMGSRVRA